MKNRAKTQNMAAKSLFYQSFFISALHVSVCGVNEMRQPHSKYTCEQTDL